MGKSRTGSGSRIKTICRGKKIDEADVYEKAKKLLEIYRDVCWDTAEYADRVKETLEYDYEYCSGGLDTALIYLEDFAPTEKKERFAEKIQSLFQVRWMVEIVDSAMVKVHEFPLNGELYSTILSMYYLSKLQYTEAEMMEALEITDCMDFLKDLPDGLETRVGEKGVGLSEGQAQRLAIARAVIRKSAFIILDESTSALDEDTEKKVMQGICALEPRPTCLLVTHRKSVLNYCDREIVISNKNVTEEAV